MMQVSLALFGLTTEQYAELAVHSEQAGIEGIWLSDHLLTPATFAAKYPYSDTKHPGYGTETVLNDSWVAIAYMSALTTRLKFGTGVFILPLRSPFVTALALATASRFSGERILFGVGTGWMREEFDAAGEDFDSRGARFEECLDVIAALLTGDEVEYHGRYFDFAPISIGGPPITTLPVIFGGVTDVALRRTVRRGDGWYGPVCSLEETRATTDALDRRRSDSPLADRPLVHHPRLVGPATYETLERYREAGYQRVVVSGGALLKGLDSAAARADAIDAVMDAARRLS
jgi:probable F420-dependent oxidoreductase